MTISVRLSDAEANVIRKYAELHRVSVSDLVRQAVMERIEEEYDLTAFARAMEAHHADPVTYTLDEVEKELEL